jgi:hypothetical protein
MTVHLSCTRRPAPDDMPAISSSAGAHVLEFYPLTLCSPCVKSSIQFVGCYILTDGYLLSRLQNIDRKKQNVTTVHTIGCTQRIKENHSRHVAKGHGHWRCVIQSQQPHICEEASRSQRILAVARDEACRLTVVRRLLLKAGENETGILPYLSHKRAQAVEMIQAWIEIERHNTAMKGCRACRKGTEHTALRRVSKGKVALLEVRLRTQPAYVGHEAKGGELVRGTLVHLMQDEWVESSQESGLMTKRKKKDLGYKGTREYDTHSSGF